VLCKQAKLPLLMFTALLLVNFALPQAYAALIAGKGMCRDVGTTPLSALQKITLAMLEQAVEPASHTLYK
jgi:hypothetical protein